MHSHVNLLAQGHACVWVSVRRLFACLSGCECHPACRFLYLFRGGIVVSAELLCTCIYIGRDK